ncbi:hypothetical protein [Nocardiopsis synnemataformans]|uniref:hypothetical protein n=1 Tax=Nocardiopsis synnemataformans TaxID=61305 RepID=UPI003EB6E116
MSRTDKTKPLWVRQREHGAVALHDHGHGPCDLPPEPTRARPDTRCQWSHPDSVVMSHGCCSGCHRRGCTAEWQRYVKADNRRRRHGDRLLTHRWVREANSR